MGTATMDPPRSLSKHREREAAAAEDGGKVGELKEEAGEPTGAMQKTEGDPPAAPDVDAIIVDGTQQLDIFDLGGKRPTSAKLTLSGKADLASGEGFMKGDRIKFTGEAIVRKSSQKDKVDKASGQVVECIAEFGAELLDLQVDSAG